MDNPGTVPLIAQANKLLKIQKMYPKEPILERAMFHAQSQHQFAGGFLALWIWLGRKPHVGSQDTLNPFLVASVRLCEEVLKNWNQYRHLEEVKSIFKIQNQLTTLAHHRPDGSCTFAGMELSNSARKQQRELRDKEGGGSNIPRLIRKRERCKSFSDTFPLHWR